MGLTAELGALGTATEAGAVERAVVRHYFDKGLAVYDAAGERFGVVADYIRQPRPLLSRVLGLPSGLMRTEKASA
jgi:hypothetical protein